MFPAFLQNYYLFDFSAKRGRWQYQIAYSDGKNAKIGNLDKPTPAVHFPSCRFDKLNLTPPVSLSFSQRSAAEAKQDKFFLTFSREKPPKLTILNGNVREEVPV